VVVRSALLGTPERNCNVAWWLECSLLHYYCAYLVRRLTASYCPYPTQVIITSGGQKRGTISGKFSLKFLPSLISGDKK
jgi:hypothetical protein